MNIRCCSFSVGVLLFVVWCPVNALTPPTSDEDLLVRTNSGLVRGYTERTRTGKTVSAFLGIRYAEPPVNDLRFLPPLPVKPWTDIFDATKPPDSCFQKMLRVARFVPAFRKLLPTTQMSEDCLKLNVWVPEPKPQNSPVIVWIHGGGYSQGSVTVPVQNGGTLAGEENVIVVSFNYRVASLGFLYLDHPDIPGNAGLYDQKVALEWIHDNIAAFGGDPGSVTLMGQSAGASSAALHAMSGLSDNTFSRMVVLSPPVVPWAVQDKNYSLSRGYKLAENAGCMSKENNSIDTTIECLKRLDPSELIDNEPTKGYNTMVFRPIVDGKIVPRLPEEIWKNGQFKATDLMLGSNRDEGTVFLTLMSPYIFQVIKNNVSPTDHDYFDLLYDFFHDEKVARIVQYEYSHWTELSNSKNVFRHLQKTVNDYFFTCSTNRMANVYTDKGQNVYKYYFVHPAPSSQAPDWFGAFHGAELYYVFGDVMDYKPKLSQHELDFGHRMMRYLGNFARTGNPNRNPDGSLEEITWPRHTPVNREYIILAPNSTSVGLKLGERRCAFWDQFFPYITKQIGYTMINE